MTSTSTSVSTSHRESPVVLPLTEHLGDLAPPSPETRIGPLDLGAATCTEPLDFANGRQHRAYGALCAQLTAGSVEQEFDEQAPDRAYNIFRWYRPGWGRYGQPDPIGTIARQDPLLVITSLVSERTDNSVFAGLFFPTATSSPLGPNLFVYAAENPLSWIDAVGLVASRPEGLNPTTLFCALRVYLQNRGIPVGKRPGGPSMDKFKHCYVSCVMDQECGLAATLVAGLFKEIVVDYSLGLGEPSFADMAANVSGMLCSSRAVPQDQMGCMRCCRCRTKGNVPF